MVWNKSFYLTILLFLISYLFAHSADNKYAIVSFVDKDLSEKYTDENEKIN